jgi:hypothetical protein
MSKRQFRKAPQGETPSYPTLDRFDGSRRAFLARLGAAVVGAVTLSACGGRAVNEQPDAGVDVEPPYPGTAPVMDSRVDTAPIEPDGEVWMGEAPMPDARADIVEPPDPPYPGFAPVMDARVDGEGGSCPNP